MPSPDQSLPYRLPEWSHDTDGPYWLNWTACSRDASVLITGTYHASQTADYATLCFDRNGALRWKDELKDAYCGVFWVDCSMDGKFAASGGWKSRSDVEVDVTAPTPHDKYFQPWPAHDPLSGDAGRPEAAHEDVQLEGFVRAYQVEPYALLLDDTTRSRVNSLELSADGVWLAAGSGDWNGDDNAVRLYRRTADGYTLAHRWDAGDASIGTLALSEDGRTLVAGDGNGTVHLFRNDDGTLTPEFTYRVATRNSYVQFVDVTPDGQFFVACDSGGLFYYFDRDNAAEYDAPVWAYATADLKNVYGVTVSACGRFVAASSNSAGGTVYLVESVYDAAAYGNRRPELRWTFHTLKPPSPSVTMDRLARYLTVADGYPVEDPGHYYLFDVPTGRCLWTYRTPNMNWPLVISDDGSAVIAGSDDAHVYFFDVHAQLR